MMIGSISYKLRLKLLWCNVHIVISDSMYIVHMKICWLEVEWRRYNRNQKLTGVVCTLASLGQARRGLFLRLVSVPGRHVGSIFICQSRVVAAIKANTSGGRGRVGLKMPPEPWLTRRGRVIFVRGHGRCPLACLGHPPSMAADQDTVTRSQCDDGMMYDVSLSTSGRRTTRWIEPWLMTGPTAPWWGRLCLEVKEAHSLWDRSQPIAYAQTSDIYRSAVTPNSAVRWSLRLYHVHTPAVRTLWSRASSRETIW